MSVLDLGSDVMQRPGPVHPPPSPADVHWFPAARGAYSALRPSAPSLADMLGGGAMDLRRGQSDVIVVPRHHFPLHIECFDSPNAPADDVTFDLSSESRSRSLCRALPLHRRMKDEGVELEAILASECFSGFPSVEDSSSEHP